MKIKASQSNVLQPEMWSLEEILIKYPDLTEHEVLEKAYEKGLLDVMIFKDSSCIKYGKISPPDILSGCKNTKRYKNYLQIKKYDNGIRVSLKEIYLNDYSKVLNQRSIALQPTYRENISGMIPCYSLKDDEVIDRKQLYFIADQIISVFGDKAARLVPQGRNGLKSNKLDQIKALCKLVHDKAQEKGFNWLKEELRCSTLFIEVFNKQYPDGVSLTKDQLKQYRKDGKLEPYAFKAGVPSTRDKEEFKSLFSEYFNSQSDVDSQYNDILRRK